MLNAVLNHTLGISVNWCDPSSRSSSPQPRGALPLWESVGMQRSFAPHFRHLDDLFVPQNLTLCTILFRSCCVPFRSPPFSACRWSFCPQNWPNLSFYSDLVGSHFELRAVYPYWFWPGVPPPPPPPPPPRASSLPAISEMTTKPLPEPMLTKISVFKSPMVVKTGLGQIRL